MRSHGWRKGNKTSIHQNLPIATKYAYTSSQTWESFNRKPIDAKYRAYMNMLVGWYMIPEENFVLQAEVAFVGVIGSHAQRSNSSAEEQASGRVWEEGRRVGARERERAREWEF
eukprot:Skav234348  [mRNA]  locus=scaffold1274:34046:35039:+ [translate_table: standard]